MIFATLAVITLYVHTAVEGATWTLTSPPREYMQTVIHKCQRTRNPPLGKTWGDKSSKNMAGQSSQPHTNPVAFENADRAASSVLCSYCKLTSPNATELIQALKHAFYSQLCSYLTRLKLKQCIQILKLASLWLSSWGRTTPLYLSCSVLQILNFN